MAAVLTRLLPFASTSFISRHVRSTAPDVYETNAKPSTVKKRPPRQAQRRAMRASDASSDDNSLSKSDLSSDESDSDNTSDRAVSEGEASDSQSEVDWNAELRSDELEDNDVEANHCLFCAQTEEDDPGEGFEEMLICDRCHEYAHRQCARDQGENLSRSIWLCPDCRDRGQPERSRLVKEVLPVTTDGSYTIFDEPFRRGKATGPRTLRKRKASSELREAKKRRKRPNEVKPEARIGITARFRSKPPTTILVNDGDRLVISFNIGASACLELREEARRQRRRERDKKRKLRLMASTEPAPEVTVSHYPALQSTNFFTSLYEISEKDERGRRYGGILSDAEADTSRTFPQPSDRNKFESARLKAEDQWRERLASIDPNRANQKSSSVPGKIKCIHFGGMEIDTWHVSPYPEEYSRNRVLHICEFCLKYMSSDFVAWRHKLKCPSRHPPGDEIYRDGQFSFFEVDGRKNPVYCRNLCLLAKLFLGSKTLYYDVEPFLFYIMTENDNEGCHFVGYFSKEKRASSLNNVSCILVLPKHQRRGFGHMLIEFSYLLTRVEGKTGSPEKPLSDMGLVSYRNYWRRVLCSHLVNQREMISISDISDRTGMTADDIVCALEGLRALVRDPITKQYAMRLDVKYFRDYVENYQQKNYPQINPDALMWVPYIVGRESQYDNAPIQTVVQREEEAVPAVLDILESMPTETAEQLEESEQPFPAFEAFSEMQTPTTPMSHDYDDTAPVPPTRFEVFPPLPGSQKKRPSTMSKRSRLNLQSPTTRKTRARAVEDAKDAPQISEPLGSLQDAEGELEYEDE